MGGKGNKEVVSLLDPATQKRIKTGTKGRACDHLQCFDRKTYIEENKKTAGWMCPVCSSPVKEHELKDSTLYKKMLSTCDAAVTKCEVDLDDQSFVPVSLSLDIDS